MKIELQKEHIDVIISALETYNRLRIAQIDNGINSALIDKNVKGCNYSKVNQLADEIKLQFFPELSKNSSYGIGYDRSADISYEIQQVLRQYRALKDPVLYNGWSRDLDEPLKVSEVPLPEVLGEDYKHARIEIRHKKVINAYDTGDFSKMWDLIAKYKYPTSSHSTVERGADENSGKYFLVLKLPTRER